MKFVLALIVIFAAGYAGRSVAAVGKKRSDALFLLADGIHMLRIRMLEERLPLRRALARSDAPALRLVGEELGPDGAGAAWRRVYIRESGRTRPLSMLRGEEVRALDRLFQDLGESARAGQDALLSAAQTEILRLAEEAAAASSGKSRLYASLGALAGLAAAVLTA